ncbi:MAG: hemerythrin domain-containing protein [Burkholderiaceae bacterium]|jgi:hemerythrin-like domain-containing protein|nr:hemerythrin domain-containing protein [Burkholderiaceae bacterium]
MTPQRNALNIIGDEHRSLAAVVDALNHVTQEIAQGKLAPDYKLLWSLIYYIDDFSDRLHHPKEDDVLFPRVRARTHDIDDVLNDLSQQHQNGIVHLNRLKTLLGRMQAEVPGAAAEFAQRVASYAGFHVTHMHQEESIVLRKAAEVLQADDWQAIADAFGANADPLSSDALGQFAADTEWFRALYRRIVALVPEPWGLGKRRAPAPQES